METFEETYLDSQFLCNISYDTKVEDINVDIIFLPLVVNLSLEEIDFLKRFMTKGGKLVVTAGLGHFSENLKVFLQEYGIKIEENIVAKEDLFFETRQDRQLFKLPSGSFYSVFHITGPGAKIFAKSKEGERNIIGGSKNLVYIGYSWGQDIDKSNDVKLLLSALEGFWPNISTTITREITENEYKKILGQINSIKKEASSIIHVTEQLDLGLPIYKLKRHYENGASQFNDFNSNYLFGNYRLARENAKLAKNEFAVVYSLGVPPKNVEVRAVWLDRGTIVSMKNERELTGFIRELAKLGFNIIFFETINAGYSVYPSEILPQNPLVGGWDPLKAAIIAAHDSGIELHAWVWTFAVGNSRHNLLIGEEINYPGPIISLKGRNFALTGENGSLRIASQPEVWVSPANFKACNYLKEIFTEVVRKYDVDGIQLDYIRFPFQKNRDHAGFDFATKNAFKKATGKLPQTEGPVSKIWSEWKIKIVNDFVKDVSGELKKIKPNLKVTAAVFGIDRSLRLRIINQDWESWLLNKWVDAVFPFYYSYTPEEIKRKLENTKEVTGHAGIVIPAYNLRVIGIGELAERITITRTSGVLGLSLFATEHLTKEIRSFLKEGAFRNREVVIPYRNIVNSLKKLADDFSKIVEKLAMSKAIPVLAESETQKEVHKLATELNEEIKNFSIINVDEIEKKVINLQLIVNDWLSLEKYLDREQRAMYVTTYLDQIRTLLNYLRFNEVNN